MECLYALRYALSLDSSLLFFTLNLLQIHAQFHTVKLRLFFFLQKLTLFDLKVRLVNETFGCPYSLVSHFPALQCGAD